MQKVHTDEFVTRVAEVLRENLTPGGNGKRREFLAEILKKDFPEYSVKEIVLELTSLIPAKFPEFENALGRGGGVRYKRQSTET